MDVDAIQPAIEDLLSLVANTEQTWSKTGDSSITLRLPHQTYKAPPSANTILPKKQLLGDKCVADVAESLIGAAFLTGVKSSAGSETSGSLNGCKNALRICKILNFPIPSLIHWSDLRVHTPASKEDALSSQCQQVEQMIGCSFAKRNMLELALVSVVICSSNFGVAHLDPIPRHIHPPGKRQVKPTSG